MAAILYEKALEIKCQKILKDVMNCRKMPEKLEMIKPKKKLQLAKIMLEAELSFIRP